MIYDVAPSVQRPMRLADFEPSADDFRAQVVGGLSAPRKTLPCKFFYDARGSRLFDRICGLDEYYPTRTEMGILRDNIDSIADMIGSDAALVEYGSGSSLKTRILLESLRDLTAYIPIDISREHLRRSAQRLCGLYAGLEVLPVCADYTRSFALPPCDGARKVVFFPGSTIGNFDPREARQFLARAAALVGRGGGMLIGVDLKKDPAVLHAAYNDRAGVTARFNLNLLARINRELGADFPLDRFAHYAPYNATLGRVEMHLISLDRRAVRVGDRSFHLEEGESIHTENSCKYTLDSFGALADLAGFGVERAWTDADALFSVQYLVAR